MTQNWGQFYIIYIGILLLISASKNLPSKPQHQMFESKIWSSTSFDGYISISIEIRWVSIRRNVMTVISLSPTDAFNKQRCQRKVDHKYICGGCDGVISKSIKSFFTRDFFYKVFYNLFVRNVKYFIKTMHLWVIVIKP